MDVIDKAKKELMDIQAKKISKSQQKKEQRAQINYNNFKRQRNEILGWLIVISRVGVGKPEWLQHQNGPFQLCTKLLEKVFYVQY